MIAANVSTPKESGVWRVLWIAGLAASIVAASIQAAEARSRKAKIAIGVGAAIVGAIILNEALKAEQQRQQNPKSTKSRRKDELAKKTSRGKSDAKVAIGRSTNSKSQAKRHQQTPAPETRQDDVAEHGPLIDDDGDGVETGALADEPPPSERAPTLEFPAVFYDKALLRRTGILVTEIGNPDQQVSALPNRCYKKPETETRPAPDGLYNITLSDEFLKRFVNRGFTLHSLCLALASAIRFNPETGERLPTFILANKSAIGDETDQRALTNEIPFDVPDCFRFGRPYSDCAMRHDPMTGAGLTRSQTERFSALGAAIDGFVAKARSSGHWARPCKDSSESDDVTFEDQLAKCFYDKDDAGWLQHDGILASNLMGSGDSNVKDSWQKQRMIDVSQVFHEGYGYSIYWPLGEGGLPPIEADSYKAANDGNKIESESIFTSLFSRLWGRG